MIGRRCCRLCAGIEQRSIDAYVSVRGEGKAVGDIDANPYPATQRMVEKLSTPDGRERYRHRKHIVEAVKGWIKQVMGFRRFSIRGLWGRQANGI
ncbi:MAG: transposase [Nitrococcus mobilis]|nr:transposase [Nitrococcus mobilis]